MPPSVQLEAPSAPIQLVPSVEKQVALTPPTKVDVAEPETYKVVVVAFVLVALTIVRLVMVLVALLTRIPPVKVARPEAEIVPMLTKLPETSMRLVPPPAPVLSPVVPFKVVPVMVFPVAIVPKPEAMLPPARAPTPVKEELTTALPKVVAERTLVLLIR